MKLINTKTMIPKKNNNLIRILVGSVVFFVLASAVYIYSQRLKNPSSPPITASSSSSSNNTSQPTQLVAFSGAIPQGFVDSKLPLPAQSTLVNALQTNSNPVSYEVISSVKTNTDQTLQSVASEYKALLESKKWTTSTLTETSTSLAYTASTIGYTTTIEISPYYIDQTQVWITTRLTVAQ